MAIDLTTQRQTAFLRGALMAATPQITLLPNTLPPTGPTPIAVTSSGGLDLSTATAASVVISDMTGITNVAVSNLATASMTLTLTLAAATAGPRTVTITVNGVSASADITVQPGMQISGFTPVPLGGTEFTINGSGFVASAPANVQFAGVGVLPITVAAAQVSATAIRVPIAQIDDNAIDGIISVTSGLATASKSGTPPPKIEAVTFLDGAGNPRAGAGGNVGDILKITGKRFITITDLEVGTALRTAVGPAFPGAGGEKSTLTELRVRVPPAASGQTGTVKVLNAGGTVQSTTSFNIA